MHFIRDSHVLSVVCVCVGVGLLSPRRRGWVTGSVLVEEIVEEEEGAKENCLHVRGAGGGEGQLEPGQCQVSSVLCGTNVSSPRDEVRVNDGSEQVQMNASQRSFSGEHSVGLARNRCL